MYTLLLILYVLVCIFLILVVLLQQGKGADVAAAFGGSSGQGGSFGPRGTTTLMHKLTTGSFVLFVMLCIGLSVLTARSGRSVVTQLETQSPEAVATPAPEQPAPATAPEQPAPTTPAPQEQSQQ